MRQRSLVTSTRSRNGMLFGSVDSQYFVGSSSPSGHSISSHSLLGLSAGWWLDATLILSRAKRDDSHSFVPSRHSIVHHAFTPSPRARSLTETALARSRRPFFEVRPGRVPGIQTKVCD